MDPQQVKVELGTLPKIQSVDVRSGQARVTPPKKRSRTKKSADSGKSGNSTGKKETWRAAQLNMEGSSKECSGNGEESASNEEWCAICHDGGDLLYCCDRCPKVYHLYCYIPKLEKEPDDDWAS